MITSQLGIELIKQFEGCRLTSYRCQANILTIGYGHTGKDVIEGMSISKSEAERLLKLDLSRFEATVNRVKVPLTQHQFDALVSLSFNIGVGAFTQSTLLRLLNSGDYLGAADQFLVWNKVKGKTNDGLVSRRKVERIVFLKR